MKSKINLEQSFLALKKYCEKEEYKGWDPYDGLNSTIFQATFFKKWDVARLVWIQLFKKNPINLRTIFNVPKQYNAKGIALFLSGYCELYEIANNGNEAFGTKNEILHKIEELSNLLLKLQNVGYSGSCWGYNFDWQARRLFLFPKNTPTVVATCFCVEALLKSYAITKNETILKTAVSASEFIVNDLNKIQTPHGLFLSYSPLKGNDTVINASLLGAKSLSLLYPYTQNDEHLALAKKLIQTACDLQESDGSWVYGLLSVQNWKDSFHTGYNLDAIYNYQKNSGDSTFKTNLEKGFDFYINSFFLENGVPKYYHDKTYPIDIHCPAELLVVLSLFDKTEEYKALTQKVLTWTISNMQDKKGFFYYQINKYFSSKISYMRWSNAFMFNAICKYLIKNDKK